MNFKLILPYKLSLIVIFVISDRFENYIARSSYKSKALEKAYEL